MTKVLVKDGSPAAPLIVGISRDITEWKETMEELKGSEASFRLSAEESRRFHEHPAAAARIVERIPRLQTVAKIIEAQIAPSQTIGPAREPDASRDPVQLGAAILHAAIGFDERRRRGLSHEAALAEMRLPGGFYHADVIAAMAHIEEVELAEWPRIVRVRDLAPGMILEQDICVQNGMCLIGSGQQITATLLQRLRGFSHVMDMDRAVSVRLPELQSV